MNPSMPQLVQAARDALLLSIGLSLPVLVVAAGVALLVTLLQVFTQVQETGWAQLPRFLAIALALAAIGPVMGHQIAQFALRVLGQG